MFWWNVCAWIGHCWKIVMLGGVGSMYIGDHRFGWAGQFYSIFAALLILKNRREIQKRLIRIALSNKSSLCVGFCFAFSSTIQCIYQTSEKENLFPFSLIIEYIYIGICICNIITSLNLFDERNDGNLISCFLYINFEEKETIKEKGIWI